MNKAKLMEIIGKLHLSHSKVLPVAMVVGMPLLLMKKLFLMLTYEKPRSLSSVKAAPKYKSPELIALLSLKILLSILI